jgi:hypothetical protein
MSRDYPTLDEQYGPGAEQADAEAQDDVATELQEAIDSRAEYNHRYWTEVATRAVEKLHRLESALRTVGGLALAGKSEKDFKEIYHKVRDVIGSPASGGVNHEPK